MKKLNRTESKVYRALVVAHGHLERSSRGIAKRAGLPTAIVRKALSAIEVQGLAEHDGDEFYAKLDHWYCGTAAAVFDEGPVTAGDFVRSIAGEGAWKSE